MDQTPEIAKWNDDGPNGEYRIADYDERAERVQRAVLGEDRSSEAYWDRMRNMSRKEGAELSARMTTMFFDEVRSEIAAEHPDWNEQERNIELCARMYGPTLAGHLKRYLEAKENK